MRIERFEMERTQCLYENQVEFNLSESGVQPMKIRDLLEGPGPAAFLAELALKYPHSTGSPELRERIAAWYGAAPGEVLVTNGTSEANHTVLWALLERRDRAAVMIPNYLQAWGLARIYGAGALPFRLVEGEGPNGRPRWALDRDGLEAAARRRPRLFLVTNPNNPTGAVLTGEEMDAVVRAARRCGAWIVADEVYRGAEVHGATTPTFWGRYDRVIVTAGLSKAFGMPGLRIGWIVAPAKAVAQFCMHHDYTTLTPGLVSERLARIAMEPARREAILQRTRSIIRNRLPLLEKWVRRHGEVLSWIPPLAGAIATVRYDLPIDSVPLFDRLRSERSVLITPGGHFGIGRYFRIGYGYDAAALLRGLERIDPVIEELKTRRRPARRASGGRRATVPIAVAAGAAGNGGGRARRPRGDARPSTARGRAARPGAAR
jgi:hypothetical protein